MSASSARKWIELNWLRKGNKEIPLPEIVFDIIVDFGACHWPRQNDEVMVGNRFYDLTDRGLIVINQKYSDDGGWVLNSIAHEWRHACQKFHGHILHSIFPREGDYKENTIWYFKSHWWEMDALLFSLKVAPDETSTLWLEWLLEGNKCPR